MALQGRNVASPDLRLKPGGGGMMIDLIEKELNLGEKEEEKENAACVYAQLRSDLLNGDFPLALRLILYC